MKCNKCGSPVTSDMSFCAECGAKVEISGSFCPKCGALNSNDDAFCAECGYRLAPSVQEKPMERERRQPVKRASGNNPAMMIIAIAAAVIAVVVVVGGIFLLTGRNDGEKATETQEPINIAVEVKEDTITPLINDFINSYTGQNDMSVAVVDNKTGKRYQSQYADASYTAWGLYLPVYLAYGKYPGFDASVLDGIVSSDAGTSNNRANDAMRHMGGLGALNDILARDFGASGTTYGRFFGESNAYADNYTTANDAVMFLQSLNETGGFGRLSYDLSSFGISAPSGAAVYAHVGTENRSVRESLNIFAVVKGQNSDYCVTILSRNGSGSYMSDLLSKIHYEMERR